MLDDARFKGATVGHAAEAVDLERIIAQLAEAVASTRASAQGDSDTHPRRGISIGVHRLTRKHEIAGARHPSKQVLTGEEVGNEVVGFCLAHVRMYMNE